MRSTTAGIVAIVAFLLAGSADAQSLEEQSIRCMSASSGIAIAGCTAVIESALGTGSRLGDAFNNRGIAYAFSAEELERSAEQRSAIATSLRSGARAPRYPGGPGWLCAR